MGHVKYLDSLVRERLLTWPQRPPGIRPRAGGDDAWLRGRPAAAIRGNANPFLKLPGTNRLRTLPDGLWLNFGGSPAEPFVDIFAIEACASLANLLDKRARFAASTQSLLAVCPLSWLLAPSSQHDPTPRWRKTGVMRYRPSAPLVLPVRDVRVMYGLRAGQYEAFMQTQAPLPHEYFVPISALTGEGSDANPALLALIANACATANFLQ
jgi:hypothetical protein